eukprot:scaffold6779_cov161-Amphora_coffeaeformis.AAC.2
MVLPLSNRKATCSSQQAAAAMCRGVRPCSSTASSGTGTLNCVASKSMRASTVLRGARYAKAT